MIAIAPEVRIPRGVLPREELRRFLREAAGAIPLRGAVAVLFTGDVGIKALNCQFRRKNKPTDILSFPAQASERGPNVRYAGDLAISADTAARQAAQCGHSLLVETKVLLLHGLLHLAGYDHEQDSGEMARRELALRKQLGLPMGLTERAIAAPAPVVVRKSAATGVAARRQNLPLKERER